MYIDGFFLNLTCIFFTKSKIETVHLDIFLVSHALTVFLVPHPT